MLHVVHLDLKLLHCVVVLWYWFWQPFLHHLLVLTSLTVIQQDSGQSEVKHHTQTIHQLLADRNTEKKRTVIIA